MQMLGQIEAMEWAAKAGPWGLLIIIVFAMLFMLGPKLMDFHFGVATKKLDEIDATTRQHHRNLRALWRMMKALLKHAGKSEDIEELDDDEDQ